MGLLRWTGAALVAMLALGDAPARAVITYDLLHDTSRARELLKKEIGGSALGSPTAASASELSSRGELETIWFARGKYLQIGENERAHLQLQLLWEKALARGVRNLPEYGAVLIREAERRMAAHDWDEASRSLAWARRIAPEELAVYTTGAVLALRRNPLNIVPAWEDLAGGARAVGRSFRLQAWLRANVLGTFLAGLALFLAAAVVLAGVAVAPRLVHDIRESLWFGNARARTILSWGAFAAPALVGLSPWWWVIIAGLLLWPYFATPARVLAAAGACFLVALPLTLRERATLLTLSERPLLEAVVQVREGHWTAADVAVLKAETQRGSAVLPAVTALGAASRHLGRLDDAETAVRAGLTAAPGAAALWNTLGAVSFARQDTAGAIAGFAKAAEYEPDLFALHHNLAVAYRESFQFAESEASSRRAGELDPEAAAYYAGIDASRLKGFMVDVPSPPRELWDLVRAGSGEQEEATELLWQSLMLGVPFAAWPIVVAVLLALGGAVGVWRLRRGAAVECPRCGRVFCPRCQSGGRAGLCSQCHNIFVRKEGVDARVRVQKLSEIRSWRRLRRLRHIVCAVAVPGGGHLSAGRFRPGLLLLLPASFLAARVLFGAGVYASPWSLGSTAATWFARAGVVAFAALWAASLWLTLRFEE